MNIEEYEREKEILERKHQREFQNLCTKYARANNPYKVGDIIKDHYQIGRIRKLHVTGESFGHPPCMIYECSRTLKSGKPTKKKATINIYQRNVKKLIRSKRQKKQEIEK
jgi:hypothetical protein